jgi:hypothetical protein
MCNQTTPAWCWAHPKTWSRPGPWAYPKCGWKLMNQEWVREVGEWSLAEDPEFSWNRLINIWCRHGDVLAILAKNRYYLNSEAASAAIWWETRNYNSPTVTACPLRVRSVLVSHPCKKADSPLLAACSLAGVVQYWFHFLFSRCYFLLIAFMILIE